MKQAGLFLMLLLLISCSKIPYTGNLVLNAGTVTTIGGRPIEQYSVGLFDISVLQQPFADPQFAIETKSFWNGRIEFEDINLGNYAVAIIYSEEFKTVQVKVGQTTTVDFFE